MKRALVATLCGTLVALASASSAQTAAPEGAANLCQELLAYAEKKAAEPPKAEGGQAAGMAAAPPPRRETEGSGTQGGGSVGPNASADTRSQGAAPTTTPTAPGAASEPATSPHASDGSTPGSGASAPGSGGSAAAFKLAGDIPLQQVRETAGRGDRQACREMTQTMRRAGGDLPAALIALAAYEPDAAKR
jgi:hypothetical protein